MSGWANPSEDDVEPSLELLLATRPDLDPRWRDPLWLAPQDQAEHVIKQDEPIAPSGQQGTNRGIGKVGQFDLHRRAQGGVGPFDLIPRRRARHAAEAEPRDLVVRRARLGEARHATGNGYHKAGTVCPATVRCLAGLGNELRLRPLDAPGHGGVTEQRQSAGIHAQSLAKISPSGPLLIVAQYRALFNSRISQVSNGRTRRRICRHPARARSDPSRLRNGQSGSALKATPTGRNRRQIGVNGG